MSHNAPNRDSSIEPLLRQALDARASDVRTSGCLDAATLAAWADDELPADVRAAVEDHAADCAACQALLVAMIKSAPLAKGAEARTWAVRVRWLVPLTAAATAAVVWLAVATAPPAEQPLPRQAPTAVTRDEARDQASGPTAGPKRQLDEKRLGNAPPSTAAPAPGAHVAPASPNRSRRPRAAAKDASENAATAAPFAAAKNAPSAAPQTAPVAEADSSASRSAAKAAPPGVNETVRVGPPASMKAEASSSGALTMIVSSDPTFRWRILAGGAVEQTSDGGATWTRQQTGVTQTLTAGSSPSPAVCWLVGPQGIVLLSTGGGPWHRVRFPEATPLVAVTATNDRTATVTTADGRLFSTGDGGGTWEMRK